MLNDPLSNVLSYINNHEKLGRKEITVGNNSKIIRKILDVLNENNYVGSYEEIDDGKGRLLHINLLGNINKVGVIKPRFNVKKDDFEKFEKRYLPAKDFGVLIVSTSKGMMIHNKAKELKLGGRLIAYCY
ncbi:TPA: 30S ribosomal protein S8 [Candidatus Woesearchaeota archaeon]|nr:30S ribosomal protein S8 [uncultured archaeon]MBS3173436.1 30S ribosomal protein S8 [Candidatus Woesearchaeota archaeon]HIH31496.1 30S ribosomal protein S8 [Candidatus Woesearchaeota archaeon]HIH54173.1 30S ribosomal protein S8 [Candidatus Woesearchaeota archaeon]HIJ01117.1 30S ribosomal protein S8 [Candidatus Woesearchaeota archaeon]